METKEILLKEILKLEAMQSDIGVTISKKCKEYADKFSEYKKGNKVKVYYKYDNTLVCYGIISMVKFSGHGFAYAVQPTKKDFSKSKRHIYAIWIEASGIYKLELHKIKNHGRN